MDIKYNSFFLDYSIVQKLPLHTSLITNKVVDQEK